MILRTKTTKANLNVKIGDTFELILSNVNNNNELVKTLVKVVDIPKKEDRCHFCRVILRGDDKTEFFKQMCCQDCKRRRSEEKSKEQMGHKRYGKEFGGKLIIGKGE